MILGKIIGSVVWTQKNERLTGVKLMAVKPVDIQTMKEDGKPLVAIDSVGSGIGEIVMVVSGSSARQTDKTVNLPTDATIIGIIDEIELEGNVIFKK